MKIDEISEEDYMASGAACPGCGGELALRLALKELGEKTIIATTPSCVGATCSVNVSRINTAFPATAATSVGMSAGLKALGKSDITVMAIAGDGGTADIGLQGLSGAAERGDDILYLCYDNEAYMNTGIQRSSATPPGSWTTTTPVGKKRPKGKERPRKDMLKVMMAHDLPYAATASTSYPTDFLDKIKKAKNKNGTRYLHVFAPCPTGWKFSPERTTEIGKLAVKSGACILAEWSEGKLNLSKQSKRLTGEGEELTPMEEYLKPQGRFKHLEDEMIEEIAKTARENLEEYRRLEQAYS